MTIKIINKINAFAKGKRVMTTISVPDHRSANVQKYKQLYGKKAIYKKWGIEYVKPFIRVKANTMMEIV